jgi:hypothetical protein
MKSEIYSKLIAMSEDAIPLSDQDWGSERHMKDANAFWIELEKHLSSEAFSKLEEYALKGTTEENVTYARELMRAETWGDEDPWTVFLAIQRGERRE